MKFGNIEIDLNAMAALVTAVAGLIMVLKGAKQRKRKKENSDE